MTKKSNYQSSTRSNSLVFWKFAIEARSPLAFLRGRLGLLQRRRHVSPELGNRRSFLGRRLRRRRRVADAGQVGIVLPLTQRLLYCDAVGGIATLELPGP